METNRDSLYKLIACFIGNMFVIATIVPSSRVLSDGEIVSLLTLEKSTYFLIYGMYFVFIGTGWIAHIMKSNYMTRFSSRKAWTTYILKRLLLNTAMECGAFLLIVTVNCLLFRIGGLPQLFFSFFLVFLGALLLRFFILLLFCFCRNFAVSLLSAAFLNIVCAMIFSQYGLSFGTQYSKFVSIALGMLFVILLQAAILLAVGSRLDNHPGRNERGISRG